MKLELFLLYNTTYVVYVESQYDDVWWQKIAMFQFSSCCLAIKRIGSSIKFDTTFFRSMLIKAHWSNNSCYICCCQLGIRKNHDLKADDLGVWSHKEKPVQKQSF